MRYLLLDRITRWIPGHAAWALKNVSLSEDFFDDHFPLKPIMPGALIIEGLAQLSGLLLEETLKLEGHKIKALLSLVEKARFRQPVYPGEQMVFQAQVAEYNQLGGWAQAQATVAERPTADCRLLFSFHEFDNPHQEQKRGEILATWLKGAQLA
jgi:3-hydroxymyristoyl/3-hydroxydecanoyl-(acyl carrier protein) dehydratase